MADESNNGNGKMTIESLMDSLMDPTGYEKYNEGQQLNQNKLGVLQRLVTAVKDKSDYMQIFLTAAFDNKQESQVAADAYAERVRYGVDTEPLLLRIVAQCGVKSQRVDQILKALTNYTLNTNYSGWNKWKQPKMDDKPV
jgi:hypothetical protein